MRARSDCDEMREEIGWMILVPYGRFRRGSRVIMGHNMLRHRNRGYLVVIWAFCCLEMRAEKLIEMLCIPT